MPRGDKSKYSSKQKRMAEHIEEGYEERGASDKEAKRRAWATVNKYTGGGRKGGSGHEGGEKQAGRAGARARTSRSRSSSKSSRSASNSRSSRSSARGKSRRSAGRSASRAKSRA